jgi:hypothetical protein
MYHLCEPKQTLSQKSNLILESAAVSLDNDVRTSDYTQLNDRMTLVPVASRRGAACTHWADAGEEKSTISDPRVSAV